AGERQSLCLVTPRNSNVYSTASIHKKHILLEARGLSQSSEVISSTVVDLIWHTRCGFCATWYITMKLHPWIPFLYAVVMFQDWVRKLNLWTVEKNFVFSYGQFLALGPSIGVVWECLTLAIRRRSDIGSVPKLFLRDVIWIVSGKGEGPDDLAINDVWDTFPGEVSPVERSLPHEAPKPPPTRNQNPFRQRRRATGRGSRSTTRQEDTTAHEVDLGQIPLRSLVNYTDYND
ncbi:hypothetical protein B0H19DRAFT_1351972, partial [Mycena capillaripes]